MCVRGERERERLTNTQHSRTHVVVRVDEGTGWVSEGVRRVRRRERLEHVREPSLSPPSPPPPPGYGMHACAVAKLQRQQPPQNAPKRLSLAHGSRQPPLNRVVLYTTTGPSSSSSPPESSSPESIPPSFITPCPTPISPSARSVVLTHTPAAVASAYVCKTLHVVCVPSVPSLRLYSLHTTSLLHGLAHLCGSRGRTFSPAPSLRVQIMRWASRAGLGWVLPRRGRDVRHNNFPRTSGQATVGWKWGGSRVAGVSTIIQIKLDQFWEKLMRKRE